MSGVFDLADVLQLIVDTFNQGSFAEQQFVPQGHEFIFHIPLPFGNELQAFRPQLLE